VNSIALVKRDQNQASKHRPFESIKMKILKRIGKMVTSSFPKSFQIFHLNAMTGVSKLEFDCSQVKADRLSFFQTLGSHIISDEIGKNRNINQLYFDKFAKKKLINFIYL
jgi:hypothetical protein